MNASNDHRVKPILGALYLGLGLWLLLAVVQAICLPFDGYVTAHLRAPGGTVGFGPLINRLLVERVDRFVSYDTILLVYGGLLLVVSLFSSVLIAQVMTATDRALESLRRPLIYVYVLLAGVTVFNFTYLSNDLYLFRLYGEMVHTLDLNPYLAFPIEQFSADQIVNVPWTDQNATYGPVALSLFALVSWFTSGIVGQFWLLKCVLVLPWVAVLVAIATSKKMQPPAKIRSMAWIGLSPVLILEVCQNAHLEGWIGLLLLGVVLVLDRVSLPRVAVAGVLFGLACGVKLSAGVAVAAIAMHLLLTRSSTRNSWKDGTVALAVFSAATLLTLTVFYASYWAGMATFDGVRLEVDKVLRSLFSLLRDTFGMAPSWIHRLALLGLISSCVSSAWLYWKRRRLGEAVVLGLVVQAYLGRTFFQPWYVAAMMFVVLAPRLLGHRDEAIDSGGLSRVECGLLAAGAFAMAGSYTGMIVTQSRSEGVLSVSAASVLLLPPLALGIAYAWNTRRRQETRASS